MRTKPIVAVVDDDEAIRKSLLRLIASAGTEVQAFMTAREFLQSSQAEVISCVVSDLRMPGINGLQLQQALQSRYPFLSMVFITGYGDIPASVSAMKAGAVDFLEKPVKGKVLLEAISRGIERSDKMRTDAAEVDRLKARYGRLTPREREVFALVAAGLLNKQVAAELGAAEKTIKQHRGSVMRKIEAESLADLVLMAERLGVRPTGGNFAFARGRLLS